MRILGISGSLQAQSNNLVLLQVAARLAPEGIEVVLHDGIRQLPHFNGDLERNGTLPEVDAWRQAIQESQALLIACPEYGFSLPGALKNGIDWVIGSGELEGKVVGVTASVNFPDRGQRGLQALLDTLAAVSAKVVGGRGIVRGEGFEVEVRQLVESVAERASAALAEAASC